MGKTAGSIILARTSWDAFLSEFIQRRRLSESIAYKSFKDAIVETQITLGYSKPSFSENTVWGRLNTVHLIRNELVHHKTLAYPQNKKVVTIIDRLKRAGLIIEKENLLTWEEQVLTPSVAVWTCEVVGQAIMELESLKQGRTRSLEWVKRSVTQAIRHLQGLT